MCNCCLENEYVLVFGKGLPVPSFAAGLQESHQGKQQDARTVLASCLLRPCVIFEDASSCA